MTTHPLTRRLVAALVGALALTDAASPAYAAADTVQASSGPGVIFEGCAAHPISYSVSPPADANYWNLDLTVQAPDGTAVDDYVFVSSGDPTAGVVMVELCGSETGAGTYSVTGAYEYYQGRITPTATIAVTPFTFDMRLPATAVTAEPATSKPRLGRSVEVEVKVTEEQPTGDVRGTGLAKVLIQRLAKGRWVKVRGAKGTTRNNGVVQLRFTQAWTGRTRFRAFANLGFPGRAASPSFVLRTRR